MKKYLCSLLLAFAMFGLAADNPSLLFERTDQTLSMADINNINYLLEVRDSWVVSTGNHRVTAGTLVNITDRFEERGGNLMPGFWLNDNDYPVQIEYRSKNQTEEFILPIGATLVVGKVEGVTHTLRPRMVLGGARTRSEFTDLMELNASQIPIRTAGEWHSYLSSGKEEATHPLHEFTQEEILLLEEGAVFKNGGLAGLVYDLLAQKLDDNGFEQVLRTLGLSNHYLGLRPDTDTTRDDKYCKSRGTCAPRSSATCTSNC